MAEQEMTLEQANAILDGGPSEESPAEDATTQEATSTEADVTAAADDEQEAVAQESESQEDADKKSEASAFAEILQRKYGTDPEKLADGLWNLMNSSSDVRKQSKFVEDKLDQVLQRLTMATAPPPSEKIEDDEDVAEANEQLAELTQRYQGLATRKQTAAKEYATLKEQMAEVEGAMKYASDDYSKGQLQQQKISLKSQMAALEDRWADIEDREASMKAEAKRLQRNIKKAEESAKAKLTQRQQQQAQRIAEEAEIVEGFTVGVKREAASYGLTDEAKLNKVWSYVRNEALAWLNREDTGAIDFEEFIPAKVAEYAELIGAQKAQKFAQKSADKLKMLPNQTKPQSATPSAPAKKPTSPVAFKSAKEAKEYTRRMLG